MGTRQTMGLFLSPLKTATGLGIGSISLAFAFGQRWWGMTQPFAVATADKVGAGRVLFTGAVLVAIGSFITPYMTSTWGLIVAIGVLSAGGAGMAGPAVLMVGIGWASAMQVIGLLVLLCLPAAFLLKGNSLQGAPTGQKVVGTLEAMASAMRNPSYLLPGAGFFVCNFHVAFLATYLPGVIASCGLPTQWAGWSLAMIGLFNIVGSVAMGWAVGRWRMKSLLSLVYAVRGAVALVFLLAPKTGPVMLIFAAVMGLTFLSTVSPTAGLVAKFFGPANMAMLFGIVMLTHQVGGFPGVWVGGKIFEATGAYDWVWYIDIVLAVGAALIHLSIREAVRPARMAPA